MKLNKSLKLLTVITSFSLLATATGVAAWFTPKAIINYDTAPISGNTLGAYFAYGNGHPTTPENPNDRVYGITVPRHLYNLAWLQYLGFFNNDDTQYYFELADNIDMTGWTLPPIGTEENPFIGNFNGNGYVIHGLTVSNNFSDFAKHPGEVQANQFTQPHILGFFGVIGDINDDLSSTSYSSAVNEFTNTGLANITIKTYFRDSLMGVAAGYVEGNMKNIAVDASTITLDSSISGSTTSYGGYTNNISDYSLVGYTTNQKQIKKVDETIFDVTVSSGHEFNAKEQGEENGWGGSIDMKTTYEGVKDAWNDFNMNDTYCEDFAGTTDDDTGVYTYPANQTIVKNDGVEQSKVSTNETAYYRDTSNNGSFTGRYHFFTTNRQNESNKKTSQYTFAHRSNTERFMYLYGSYDFNVDDAVEQDITNNNTINATLIKIKCTTGGRTYFMTYNNGSLGYTENENNATTWIYNNNYIYYNNTSSGVSDYYYIYNNNGTLVLYNSTNYRTQFTHNTSDDTYYTTYNNQNQYICFYDNAWHINYDHTQSVTYRTIQSYSYSGNYLTVTSGTTLGNTTSATTGAIWLRDDRNRYYTSINGIPYYLVYNNGLSLSTSTTGAFTVYNTDYLRYRPGNSGNYNYVYYTGSAWSTVSANNTNNSRRLRLGTQDVNEPITYDYATSTSAGTSYTEITRTQTTADYKLKTQSTYFPLRQEESASDNYFRIYCTNNNTRYYLYGGSSNTATLSISNNVNNASTFIYDGNGYGPIYNDGAAGTYIRMYSTTAVRLYSVNTTSNYPNLSYDGTRFYCTYNGTTYYLRYANSSLSLTTTRNNATAFTLENLGIETPNGIPQESNTGYIIGGSNDTNKNQGNIRISQYFGAGYSSPSIKGCSVNSDNTVSIDSIYTINSSGVVAATSSLFGQNSPFTNTVSSMESVFSEDPQKVYGLHFMDSEMLYGNGKSVIAESVTINKNTYSNYEFPQNCIDFNLKEKGYINFIAGTYFPGNNCFFTLSEVQRNATGGIVNMKNIRAIYTCPTEAYSNIYQYSDGTYSVPYKFKVVNDEFEKIGLDDSPYTEYSTATSLPSGYNYTLKFNCDWIDTRHNEINDNVTSSQYDGYPFYFEIPMNDGEYAMGSPHFSSGDAASGAYLMYLDIGANAAKMQRTIFTEHFSYETLITSYPDGVALVTLPSTYTKEVAVLDVSVDIDCTDSACVEIRAGYTSSFAIDRANGDVTLTRTNQSNAPPVYAGETITLIHDSGSSTNIPIVPISNDTYDVKRLTYYDVNVNLGSLTRTVITDTSINNGAVTRTIIQEVYEGTDTSENPTITYVYDGTTDQRNSMKIYNTSNGVRYSSENLISQSSLPIGTVSNTPILKVRIVQNGGAGFEEDILLEAVLDPSDLSGKYYLFSDYLITITPDGEDVVVVVKSFSSGKVIYYGTTQVTGANQTITITA